MGKFPEMMWGILRKSNCFLMMKNKTEEMMSYSSGSQTDFNNENRRNVEANLSKLYRHSSRS